jgi:zinc protease
MNVGIGRRVGGAVLTVGWLALVAGEEARAQARPIEAHVSYTQYTLENGLNLLVHTDHSLPLVAVNVWYHVGSANERPGRTGFAHLFEHIMFEGSAHVPEGDFDNLLEGVGGTNNGSTNTDRTNYFETLPSNAVELALWLEADRMGWLLDAMDQTKLDLQRDVVKNERRQGIDNRPYGIASETLLEMMYPEGHPYRWPVIGSMDDLTAATIEDVSRFFRTYYAPNNASLVISGNISARRALELTRKYFGEIPSGPAVPDVVAPDPTLDRDIRRTLEDDVRLPRLYLAWHTPAGFSGDDAPLDLLADVLGRGRNSRLQRRLVFEEQVAQSVSVFHSTRRHGSTFQIQVTGRPDTPLARLEELVHEELRALVSDGVREEELERAIAGLESRWVRSIESLGGRADILNYYYFHTGDPGYLRKDLNRFRSVSPEEVGRVADEYLVGGHVGALSIVPVGRTDLSADAPVQGGGS